MKFLESDKVLRSVIPNIAQLLDRNVKLYNDKIAYREVHEGHYAGITWEKLYHKIVNIAWNLKSKFNFIPGDKMVIYSPNRLEMLEMELAVMASGGIAVPIFAYFHRETAMLLIKHSDARFLAVAGDLQLLRLDLDLSMEAVFVFDDVNQKYFDRQHQFSELLTECYDPEFKLSLDADPDEVCLNMYTSGTMGIPKCVQLMHRNILSQQAALSQLWNLDSNDRFLSYLPWHHSFGGIFELFSALANGATYSLDSGYGKDPKVLMENWKAVQPTVFFSVPKVYQMLMDLIKQDPLAEQLFFHPQLKFVFTAAAALPQKLSDEFSKRGVPVIEGWGLTETSPCCTLTDPAIKRENGVVGKPIPGVAVRLAEDGEIQVNGPNVMKGYYKNDEANKNIFTPDGWYCTGDVGEITATGLKLVSRKDRIFKLTNGEKVIPSEMEQLIQSKCHYVTYAMVVGGGEEYPVALLFPNKKLIDFPDYEMSPEEGCFCPRSLNELGKCLAGCLHDVNCGLNQKFSKVRYAMIIDDELSIDKNTLTPSMKMAPKNVMEAYKGHIKNLYGSEIQAGEDVFIIKLDTEDTTARKILM